MKRLKRYAIVASLLVAGTVAAVWAGTSTRYQGMMSHAQSPGGWHGMMDQWSMGPHWGGPGPMPRHHVAMMWGVPAPYKTMSNPLPRTQATLAKGAAVYNANCAPCHGPHGLGDGNAGRGLSPPPGNLAWLSDMPMSRWDGFMYWTIAEGGSQFGTDMPAFKGALSRDQIWAVTAYIQAHLPPARKLGEQG